MMRAAGTKRLGLRIPVALLVAAVVACSSEPEPLPDAGEPCPTHFCAEGSACVEGYCHSICDSDGDCSSESCAQVNLTAVCLLPAETSCSEDVDCLFPRAPTCLAGRCRQDCRDDPDCLPTQTCAGGACVDEVAHEEDCRAMCTGRSCGRAPRADCAAEICGSCGGELVCTHSGACSTSLDPSSRWVLHARSGEVAESRVWETACEVDACPPDPYLLVDGHATSEATDTYSPAWNEDILALTAAELMTGVTVTYLDSEWPFDSESDVICPRETVQFSMMDFASGGKEVVCENGSYRLRLWPE